MKTAMQQLILKLPNEFIADNPSIILELLEKEKEQIIQAGNACGLKAIAYHKKLFEMSKDELEQELIKDGMTHGEEYYNQNYNQNK